MGGGGYSTSNRAMRSTAKGYDTKSRHEIFTRRQINNAMNPYGIKIREARDSKEHPNSLAIVLGLDVTGSMGSIPHYLVKEGLPNIMGSIIQKGIKDPQLLFLGIGDHECDNSPLQVGQFESNDELLDKWLTDVYLEGGGGGNYGESYLLAWYFAGFHTAIDCFEKRNKKGFLFTIGDEPVLKSIPSMTLRKIMGSNEQYYTDYTTDDLLNKAREIYTVKHLHLKQGSNGNRPEVMDGWKQLIQDDLIIVENKMDIANIITDIVTKETSLVMNVPTKEKSEEIIL